MVTTKIARTLGSIRCQSSSSRLAPAPEIAGWIERITSRPAEVTCDDIDDRRASQLRRTLPTRLGPKGGLNLPDKGTLPKAHHLAYFQPGSLLTELGEDGSSTVRYMLILLMDRPADPQGIQCARTVPSPNVGRRVIRVAL
jgi:hypothetical protein